MSPPTALAADIFYWYILSHVRSPASSGVSDVSGGVCSTASAAIVCVTVLLEDYPKSEAFFNGSRQHFPPSLSFSADSTYFNYSESSRCTDSSYFPDSESLRVRVEAWWECCTHHVGRTQAGT